MSQKSAALKRDLKSTFALIVIPSAFIVGVLIYKFVLGNPNNFEGNDPANHPLPGNYLGIIYKGGVLVPLLLTLAMLVIIFPLERFLTISKAKGKGGMSAFVKKIRMMLANNDIDAAVNACDKQKGSVANVVRAGLMKYKEMERNRELDKDSKVLAIQKDIEETTQLEMPMLERNLVVIATVASIATLVGLLGTVLGMIKAFSALATAGAPDAVALANGISEALINTAFGIGASAVAIITYNYFTSAIDSLTYAIDEAGYTITQQFAASHSDKVSV